MFTFVANPPNLANRAVPHFGEPRRELLPVRRAAITIANNVSEFHKSLGTGHRADVRVPEAAPKCKRV